MRNRVNLIVRRPFWAPNPDLFSGVGVIAIALIVLFIIALFQPNAAQGQSITPREQRTVTWYVQNPQALDIVTQACRDNPGRFRADPDCINADQARVVVAHEQAERESNMRGAGRVARPYDLTPPSNPQYWRDRPAERREKLAYCSRMTPYQQANFFCDPARQAENGRMRRS
jgi:hypothetical protein